MDFLISSRLVVFNYFTKVGNNCYYFNKLSENFPVKRIVFNLNVINALSECCFKLHPNISLKIRALQMLLFVMQGGISSVGALRYCYL